jgi:hypothetical protein
MSSERALKWPRREFESLGKVILKMEDKIISGWEDERNSKYALRGRLRGLEWK